MPKAHLDYYSDDMNFEQLAKDDGDFGKVYQQANGYLDWQDPSTIQALTKAILRQDFDLQLTLPNDRLCPPVPVRWNYIRWIQELIDTTSGNADDGYDAERQVTGLDIGVGASCIYDILACAARPEWRMLGTDIDTHSLEYASKNVNDNNFQERIRLKQCASDALLIPLDDTGIDTIDFVLCNPPFYSSEDDMKQAYTFKTLSPSAVCTGSTTEMICPGGDLGFATRIFEESLVLRERVQWYTCMFGRLASAQQLVTKLKDHGISNFAATNLKAGQKTVRWALAWSFGDRRPRNDVARHGSLIMALLPAATERTIAVPDMMAGMLGKRLDHIMSDLDLRWQYKSDIATGLAASSSNVWSRSARRKKQRNTVMDDSADNITFAVKIVCDDGKLDIRWLRGNDTVLLESFVGMLKTSLGVRKGIS